MQNLVRLLVVHLQKLASLTAMPTGREMDECTVDMYDFSSVHLCFRKTYCMQARRKQNEIGQAL